MSAWLISSQQSQPEPVPSSSASTQSDLDLASQASVLNLGENVAGTAFIDLRLAIDPLPPRGNFVHFDFLKLQ